MSFGFVLFAFWFCSLKNVTEEKLLDITEVIDRTCKLKPEEGPCRANLKMFYFDPSSMNCSEFSWGGCQGNGNRFYTAKECMSHCVSKREQKVRPQWCSLSFDYGYCFGQQKRWYYDPLYRVCKMRMYSGCGGNQNNFKTKQECSEKCIYLKKITDDAQNKKQEKTTTDKDYGIKQSNTVKEVGNR